MMGRKDGIVTRLRESVEALLKKAGVEVLRGTGRSAGPGKVVVERQRGVRRHDHRGGRQDHHRHGLGTGPTADVRLLATRHLDLH